MAWLKEMSEINLKGYNNLREKKEIDSKKKFQKIMNDLTGKLAVFYLTLTCP